MACNNIIETASIVLKTSFIALRLKKKELCFMELCEYLGGILICYSLCNRRGHEFWAESWYESPVHEFLRRLFEVL